MGAATVTAPRRAKIPWWRNERAIMVYAVLAGCVVGGLGGLIVIKVFML